MSTRLSHSLRAELRLFAFYLANGTIDDDVLDVDETDYLHLLLEPSKLEMIFAIFANVLELDETGTVLNAPVAMRRAAQYIRECVDDDYTVDPPWRPWEVELH